MTSPRGVSRASFFAGKSSTGGTAVKPTTDCDEDDFESLPLSDMCLLASGVTVVPGVVVAGLFLKDRFPAVTGVARAAAARDRRRAPAFNASSIAWARVEFIFPMSMFNIALVVPKICENSLATKPHQSFRAPVNLHSWLGNLNPKATSPDQNLEIQKSHKITRNHAG